MALKDPIKRRAWGRNYYKTHRAERLAYMVAYYRDNRTKKLAYNSCDVARFCTLRYNAKKRNIPLRLTFKQFVQLVAHAKCHYCGGPLPRTGHGLDRKNSKLSYSTKNCVPCCQPCNWIRGKDIVSYSEMLEVAKLLARLRRRK